MYNSEIIAEEKVTKTTMKCVRCNTSSRVALCAIVYVLYIIGTSLTPVEGTISRSSGRRHVMGITTKDIDIAVDVSPHSHARSPGAHGNGRRLRPRRSSSDEDLHAFRRLMHEIRNARRGARTDYPGIMRRNSGESVSERASIGNKIANTVKSGGCQLIKQWIPVSKPGCKTNYVLAPTCRGMCETWEIPDVNPPYVTTHHRVCRPAKIENRSIRLRRCDPGVNEYHVVPMAQSCQCMKCNSRNTACRPLL